MQIHPISTEKILPNQIKVEEFLDKYIKSLKENSIVAISSKVIAIMENNVVEKTADKKKLIRKEADFIANKPNYIGQYTTFKFNALISAAGIDQSNGNGLYILLPKNPQKTAKEIYKFLSKKFKIKNFGVIITDSRSNVLRIGATGIAIGFWGFSPLKNYIGTKDLFGRKFEVEQENILDGLASAANLILGEGAEQTPIAIIDDINFIKFSENKPTKKELDYFYVSLEEDIFHQFYRHMKRPNKQISKSR